MTKTNENSRNVNGAGGVSVGADGRVRYYLTIDGVTIYKRAPSEREANRRLEAWKAQVARGEVEKPGAEKLTVSAIFDLYIGYKEAEAMKSNSYPSMLRYMREYLGSLPALKLTSSRVEAWRKEEVAWRHMRRQRLDEKKRARGIHVRDYGFPEPEVVTVQNYLGCLRAAFKHAVKRGVLRAVPFQVFLPTPKNALRGFFEVDEWDRVRVELASPPGAERDGQGRLVTGSGDTDLRTREKGTLYADFCHFGYLYGVRREEAEALSWGQVDRAAREIRLYDTKNGNPRLLAIEGELAEMIERRWAAREWKNRDGIAAISHLVFHFDGKPVGDFRKAWRSACQRAGVAGKKPYHDFRRTAARDGVRAGVPQRVMQQQLGHETSAMFDRYNIVSADDLRSAMRATAAYRQQRKEESKVSAISGRKR